MALLKRHNHTHDAFFIQYMELSVRCVIRSDSTVCVYSYDVYVNLECIQKPCFVIEMYDSSDTGRAIS